MDFIIFLPILALCLLWTAACSNYSPLLEASCRRVDGNGTGRREGGRSCPNSTQRCANREIDISAQRFKPSPICECQCRLQELQELVDNGFESWRTDPAAVASQFMQNCFIDPCFRGIPNYLAGSCSCCDKTYVVLGVTCAGKMIFELCQPVKCGDGGIWTVSRYAKYCG